MKIIVAIMATMFAYSALSAQPNVGENVNYYGVDFSKAKTFGAAETGWEFKEAFGKINSLVIAEWPKYNPGEFLLKNIVVRDISATTLLNSEIDPKEVAVSSSTYVITKEEVADMVRRYKLQEKEGTGLVIIGELMDKSAISGRFIVVYFDIASREVLHGQSIVGKTRGFGLRNYWAGALYNALRSVQ